MELERRAAVQSSCILQLQILKKKIMVSNGMDWAQGGCKNVIGQMHSQYVYYK